MFTIQIIANCPEGLGEVDPKSLEGAACLIEESVSLLLVQLCYLIGHHFIER